MLTISESLRARFERQARQREEPLATTVMAFAEAALEVEEAEQLDKVGRG